MNVATADVISSPCPRTLSPRSPGAGRHSSTLSSVRRGAVLPSKPWMDEQVVEGKGVEGRSGFASSLPSEAASWPPGLTLQQRVSEGNSQPLWRP